MAYPTPSELNQFLVDSGVISSPLADTSELTRALETAQDEFELLTGWVPFIASGITTRRFDATGEEHLFLDAGIVSLDELTVGGVALTENTDFYLHPYNSTPKTHVVWDYGQSHEFRDIAISAEWGYASACPADVYDAIRKRAASLYTVVSSGPNATVKRLTQGGLTIEYAMENGQVVNQMGAYDQQFDQIIKRYRRYGGFFA